MSGLSVSWNGLKDSVNNPQVNFGPYWAKGLYDGAPGEPYASLDAGSRTFGFGARTTERALTVYDVTTHLPSTTGAPPGDHG